MLFRSTEIKSGDHREITHGIGLKSHKLLGYLTLNHIVHIQIVSENLNNLTSTKFVRFSNFILVKRFSNNFSNNIGQDKHL